MVLTTGIDIYCSKAISQESIQGILKKRIPTFDFDMLGVDQELMPEESDDPRKAVFVIEEIEAPLFPFCISIFLAKEHQPQERFLQVAQDMAFLTKADSVCGYVNADDPENPYYSILFKPDGTSYLIDDIAWEENQGFEVLESVNFDF